MLASLIQQYGPLLHGPAGIAIPVGLPLVFAVGWWVYRYEEPVVVDESNREPGEA